MAALVRGTRLLLCLALVVRYSAPLECPTSFAEPDDSIDALSEARINLYLDEADFEGGKRK